MNDKLPNTPQTLKTLDPVNFRQYRSQNLIKQLFKAEVPEEVVKKIPAQTLYIALKANGIQSSSEILEIITHQQMRLVLDFDCWNRDQFNEDNFWEWLAITDATEGLELLQKILNCCDLKWVALLISRYVDVVINEEPTDEQPDGNYITPDKGYTWINVNHPDSNKEFLLSRLLAMIFDTNAELFYQIISIPTVSTPSLLEEESFQDKERRMRSEGIFTLDESFAIHVGISKNELLHMVKNKSTVFDLTQIKIIEPLIFDSQILEPLNSLINEIPNRQEVLAEISQLINTAIVRWAVPFYEFDQVNFMAEKIKGAINIGLEYGTSETGLSPIELYKQIGLAKIYQRGLFECLEIRRLACQKLKTSENNMQEDEIDFENHDDYSDQNIAELSPKQKLIQSLSENFPCLPAYLKMNNEKLVIELHANLQVDKQRALEKREDLELARKIIEKISINSI